MLSDRPPIGAGTAPPPWPLQAASGPVPFRQPAAQQQPLRKQPPLPPGSGAAWGCQVSGPMSAEMSQPWEDSQSGASLMQGGALLSRCPISLARRSCCSPARFLACAPSLRVTGVDRGFCRLPQPGCVDWGWEKAVRLLSLVSEGPDSCAAVLQPCPVLGPRRRVGKGCPCSAECPGGVVGGFQPRACRA